VSGRIDGFVTFVGIFAGIAIFTLTVDWFPGLQALYLAGSGEVSLLHEVFGVPALVLALVIVAGAVLAFVGAEKVEILMQRKREPVELTPPSRPRLKLAVGGSLAVLGIVTLTAGSPLPDSTPIAAKVMAPLELAESIIEREPGILILDLRADPGVENGIPGAVSAPRGEGALEILTAAPEQTTVVVFDDSGALSEAPGEWPRNLEYRVLMGGMGGWINDVLTPWEVPTGSLDARTRAVRQNQIAAFFSGAAVQSSSMGAPPPMMPAGGAGKKPKSGGC